MTTRQISYRLKADGAVEAKRDAQAVGDALESAGDRGAAAFGRTSRSLQNTTQLTDQQIERYRRLADQAEKAARAQQAQEAFNGALGVRGGTGLSAKDFLTADELNPSGLTRGQRAGRLNLLRQGADVFTTGAMGMDPAMIAIQQGPQILDGLAQAGIKATPALLGVAGVITAISGALIAATAAGMQYESQQIKVNVATAGLGAELRMTVADMDAYARAGAEAADVSVNAAVNMGVAYATTGKIGGQVMADLIAITKRYALTTGQDIDQATQDLAKHFSTGSQGVVELNDKLHFLNATELEHIKNLMDSGRETEAQALAVEGLNKRLLDAKSATSGWDYVLGQLGKTAEDVWRKVGKAIAIAMGGGSDQEKLQELLVKRSQAALEQRSSWLYLGKKPEEFDAEIREVQKRIAASARAAADAAANARDNERAGIAAKYQDPNIRALQDQRNMQAKYLSLGGSKDDATYKAIQREIDALTKGYASADEMARKLAASHDKAIREGNAADRKRDRDAKKTARDIEEQIRMDGLRADHELDNMRRLAQARGDESALDVLERQGRLQDEINRYLREGFNLTQATANARAQVAAEMSAEAGLRAKKLGNPEGFVSSEERMAKALKDANIAPFRVVDEYIDRIRFGVGDAFHDGLMAGMTGGDFFKVFAERLKYAAASGLADSLTSSLFASARGDSKGGLVTVALSKLFKGFASGTDLSPGGLSLVGEYGPEIVRMPTGSSVHSAATTQALLRGAAQGSGGGFSMTYAPQYTVTGGDAEAIKRLEAAMAQDRAEFRSKAVAAIIDAKSRRVPGVG